MFFFKPGIDKKIGKLLFIALLYGLLSMQQAHAATYYVSPSGSDSNKGTSLSTPLKTIKNAIDKAKTSGDIIYVLTGTYSETVYITQSGITLSAYQNSTPVIDGGSRLPKQDWGTLLTIMGNHNTVSGFEVKNSNINGSYLGGYGVQIAGHHNTVGKMNVHHTWEVGVLINGDYNIVEDSKIWQAARQNLNGGGNGWSTGISAARNNGPEALIKGITSYATIRRNKVYNNWGEGLSCYEADHCTLEDNVVYDNYAVNLYLSDTPNSVVQRNLVYISSAPAINVKSSEGIALADEVSSVPRSANNKIVNNFLYNANLSAFSWTIVPGSGLKNVLIANNTLVDADLSTGHGGTASITNTSSQIRNNIVTGKSNYLPNVAGISFSNNNWSVAPPLAKSSTDISADPRLLLQGSTAPGELTPEHFKLSSNSPMINSALPLGNVDIDFFKTARGANPDIGAHELVGVIANKSAVSSSGTVTNIAPSAQLITASSQSVWTNQQAIKAVDGAVDGYPGDYTEEWAASAQGRGAWLELRWTKSHRITQVKLYDRPNTNDQITSATLTFGDGSTVKVGALTNTGKEVVVNFPAKDSNRLKVTINTVSGTTRNAGLSELKVFGL